MTQAIALTDYVFQSDNTIKTTSLNVAKAFDKKHSDVLRKIDEICTQVSDIFEKRNFAPLEIERTNNLGKIVKDRAYELTKDGFMLLVMGFTGKKAMQTKIAFIEAFNWMAAQLGMAKSDKTTPNDRTGLRQAVTMLTSKRGLMHGEAYTLVHQRFNVEHINQIPREKLGEAVEYVQRMALDGELLPKKVPEWETPEYKAQHRRGAIALMTIGLEMERKQSDILRKMEDMLIDVRDALNDARSCSGAIFDGLHESQFHLCFETEIMKSGHKLGRERGSLRDK